MGKNIEKNSDRLSELEMNISDNTIKISQFVESFDMEENLSLKTKVQILDSELSRLMKIISERRSVRDFTPQPIDEAPLKRIIEAGRLAPSSNNTQPWRFVAVTDAEMRVKLSRAVPMNLPSHIKWVADAPVVLVCCSKPHPVLHTAAKAVVRDFHEIDVTIAIEHIVLAARAFGIGSCWVGWFSQRKVKKLLDIPRSIDVIALLPLGYPRNPAEDNISNRLPLGDILSFERWSF